MTDTEWLLAGMDRVWRPVASPLGLFLALLVTAHVLLTKRDVSAAIGWIGLAWLAPTWGALAYLMFGINRVVRRAQRVRRPRQPRERNASLPAYDIPHDLVPLERAVRRITNRIAENGNAISVLHNGDEAYPAMIEAIAGAQHSVGLSSYIFRDDEVGQQFMVALKAAQARGAEVCVLVDGIGSGYFPPIERLLRHNGIRVALFMHSALPWRMPFLNLRNHKKMLLLDGLVGFAGGMNISAANVLARQPVRPVADTHFRFDGPVVAQLADAFAQDWSFTTGEHLQGERWFPAQDPKGAAVARVVSSGPDQDLEKIQSVLLEAISCAVTSIQLMTPYFLPGDEIITALGLAAMRGVRVDVIVPRRSDHRFVDIAMRAHVGPLLTNGVRFWLGPEPFNHGKLMVLDGQWCFVGSSNWDMRSLRLNFELGIEIYDPPLAATLEAVMKERQRDRLHSRDLNARSLPVRLRDAACRLMLPYI